MSFAFNPFTGTFDIVGAGVQGPSSSTNLAIAIYNGTSGQIIKNTNVTIDANNFVYGAGILSDNNLPALATLTVGANKQYIVMSEYYLSGTLILEGQMLIL